MTRHHATSTRLVQWIQSGFSGATKSAAIALSMAVSLNAVAGDPCDTWVNLNGGITLGGGVAALQPHGGELIAGGFFSTAGGVTVNHVARWNGAVWQPFDVNGVVGVTGASQPVSALTVLGESLVIGGNFTTAGGMAINRIALWDDVKGMWQPFGTGMNLNVLALAVHGGQLVAGGDFATAGGVNVNRIARWNGAAWEPFNVAGNIGVNNRVNCISVINGELIIGGGFTTAGGQTVNGIARWNGASWEPFVDDGHIGLAVGVPNGVRAMTVYKGDLVVGGGFQTTTGGLTVNHIARWDGEHWHPFISNGIPGVQSNGFVNSLTVYNGDLIVGGFFPSAGGETVWHIMRWDGTGWQPFVVNGVIGLNSQVDDFAQDDDSLFIGGAFFMAGGQDMRGITQWTDCPASVPGDITGDGTVGVPDLLAVINSWGACPPPPATCPADIAPPPDGDGVVGVADLLMVINNWG